MKLKQKIDMSLFNNNNAAMDVIRCDEPSYLIWKWSPKGMNGDRQNAIRYGSSLRVKDGEAAVFVYSQEDGPMQDFIMGPHDSTIKTANFPILASLVGMAFGGKSPFQAEVYFINLQGNNQVKFGAPWFDVPDPRFLDFSVPVSARGTITFNIQDCRNFIKLNRMAAFDLASFQKQVRDCVNKRVKSIIANAPSEKQSPVLQLERHIGEISASIQAALAMELENDFGIVLKRLDLGAIDFDKESQGYRELRQVTATQVSREVEAKTTIGITNLSETMRIQREGTELQVQGNNFAVHQLNQQTAILKAAAENLSSMGNVGLGGGGGFNPAGLAMGMAVGGTLGGQVAGMMGKVGQAAPPPVPGVFYHVALAGQQSGPFSLVELGQLSKSGGFTKGHHAWKEGMPAWELAANIPELTHLFAMQPPPPPIPAP
ncbi:SPFH domain-containing protein [Parasediminibacterium sp. JCM 36343]|uniref:SPFH domain-containing protein n=1 Tax=Parasediminibacterium sp. JCM 36343 TaxID=3374279 RepID=UPI00397B4E48